MKIEIFTDEVTGMMAEAYGGYHSRQEKFREVLESKATPSGIVTIAHLWHLYSEEDQLDIARELVGLYHMQMFQLLMDILDKMIEKDREKEEWFK